MPDFNNKKEILRRLRVKKEKNKALRLPCAVAELCVKAWYAVMCRAGLALSDKNGRFLGVGKVGDKPPRRRQDDIVYVKKPFWRRLLSAALAASFVMMFLPELGISFDVSASNADYVTFAGLEGDYLIKTEYEEAKELQITGFKQTVFANKAAKISWDHPNYSSGPNNFTYRVGYITGNGDTINLSETWKQTVYTFDNLLENTQYEFFVTPLTTVRRFSVERDENGDPVTDPVTGDFTFVANGTYVVEGKPCVSKSGFPNVKLTKVYPKSINFDGNAVILRWDHKDNSVNSASGEPPYGYVIFRRNISYTNTGTSRYEMVGEPFSADSHLLPDGLTVEYRDTDIQFGSIYEYYIRAYTDMFGGSEYNEGKIGIIDSGDHTVNAGNTLKLPIPPAKVNDFKVETNQKDTLTITWNTPTRSNVDGYFLYRSDTEFKESDIQNIVDGEGKPIYWDAETQTWMFYKYIMDMKDQGKAVQLKPNNNSYDDKYDSKNNSLINDKPYYYYVFPYVDADSSGVKKLYGPVSSGMGIINAAVGQPQNLTVTTEDGKVTLKWDAVTGADGYRIYITKLKDHNGSTSDLGDKGYIEVGKVTTYTISNLLNGDQYSYRIKAFANVASDNVEDPTKLFSVYSEAKPIVVGNPLTAPQDMKATTEDGRVQVEWSSVDDADGYVLYYQKNNGEWENIELTGTRFDHTGLNNGDVYRYYTKAFKKIPQSYEGDGKEQVVYSPESVTISMVVGIPLDAPKDFTGTTSDGRVTLEWSEVDGAEGYILYYRKNGGAEEHIDLSEPGFEHIGLNNGDTYTYYVLAYKTVNGKRIYSDRAQARQISFTVGSSLEAPKDFTAVTTDGQTALSWTAVPGATGYVLYAYGNGRSYQFDLSRTTYQHTGLDNGDSWTYYVVSYKTVNGQRVYSSPTRSITVTIGVSLNAVIDLIATAGNRQVDLEWSEVEGAEGYVVYLYNTKKAEFEPITVVSDTEYSHVGLKNGQKYTYMVAPFKTINGERRYGEYSMSVDAIPTTGSITDIDHSLNVKGTTPYGISHSEYISAAANHGAFDDSVDVYFSTNKESTEAVKEVLKEYAEGLKSFIIYPFDISVYEENTLVDVEPYDGYSVTITMPIPDRLIAYRDYITVVHIGERLEADDGEELGTNDDNAEDWIRTSDGRLEVLPCAIVDIDNVWCVQFVCSSFSPYALVIYKEHITDVSAGGGIADGSFAGTFNSGILLFTALPDIMPENKKLRIVRGGSKRYRIKNVEKR